MTNDHARPDAHDDGDALDRLIAEAARDYHQPPAAVPREAMWEAIVSTRAARAGAGAPVAGVVSIDAARARHAPVAPAPRAWRTGWSLAAAASLLLAAGVGVGRWWEGQARGAGRPDVAVTPAESPRATAVETRAPETAVGPVASAEPGAGDTPEPRDGGEPRGARAVRVIPPRTSRPGAPMRGDDGALAYDVAAVRHLTSVEALLVAYRADPLDSLADARVAAWARTLLQDTRLLLDSPAAASPVRRRLFEDLELVLVQMARLAPREAAADSASPPARLGREREERSLIDGAMRDARVLPRLRRAIPAGVGA